MEPITPVINEVYKLKTKLNSIIIGSRPVISSKTNQVRLFRALISTY